jgi:hypothetical protein
MQNTLIRTAAFSTGLCGTCRNAPGCTFPRTAGVPVVECLEFDGESKVESAPVGRPVRTRLETTPREHGLCPWCDKRPTCVFAKPAGGVWFCEEYQ